MENVSLVTLEGNHLVRISISLQANYTLGLKVFLIVTQRIESLASNLHQARKSTLLLLSLSVLAFVCSSLPACVLVSTVDFTKVADPVVEGKNAVEHEQN